MSDTDNRFKEYARVEDTRNNKIQEIAVSAKFTDETQTQLDSIAVQPFVDETTPHGGMGVQVPPDVGVEILTNLELLLAQETDLL